MSNIAVQNASEDTGPITETGVNNIVPITLTSLTAALMMIELSNMIDYITFEYTCYFKMSQLIYSLISHDAECCFYSSSATSRATDLLALTNFNGRWTHTFCVQANLPIIMAPLMLRRGRLRILQHRVGQKASPNASSCTTAAPSPTGRSSTLDGVLHSINKASTRFPTPASRLDHLRHTE